jgi:hypothetical protein
MLKSAMTKRTTCTAEPGQRHHTEASTTTVSSSEDFGILQLGSSVTVNEDARRIIFTDIQEIESAITTTQQQVSQADATAAELAQRHERSEWEVAGLREESHELLDQMTMNATILAGLDTTLHTQIIPPDNDDNDDKDDEPAPNECVNAVSNSTDHTTPVTPTTLPVISAADFRHQVQETVAETDWMEEQHRETADKIQTLVQQKNDTVASLGVVLAVVQREQLPVQHANAKWHTEAAATTLHEETNRLRALERKVDQANERCVVLDQECDKRVRTYLWKW